jgi:hypothetical protein
MDDRIKAGESAAAAGAAVEISLDQMHALIVDAYVALITEVERQNIFFDKDYSLKRLAPVSYAISLKKDEGDIKEARTQKLKSVTNTLGEREKLIDQFNELADKCLEMEKTRAVPLGDLEKDIAVPARKLKQLIAQRNELISKLINDADAQKRVDAAEAIVYRWRAMVKIMVQRYGHVQTSYDAEESLRNPYAHLAVNEEKIKQLFNLKTSLGKWVVRFRMKWIARHFKYGVGPDWDWVKGSTAQSREDAFKEKFGRKRLIDLLSTDNPQLICFKSQLFSWIKKHLDLIISENRRSSQHFDAVLLPDGAKKVLASAQLLHETLPELVPKGEGVKLTQQERVEKLVIAYYRLCESRGDSYFGQGKEPTWMVRALVGLDSKKKEQAMGALQRVYDAQSVPAEAAGGGAAAAQDQSVKSEADLFICFFKSYRKENWRVICDQLAQKAAQGPEGIEMGSIKKKK